MGKYCEINIKSKLQQEFLTGDCYIDKKTKYW